MKKNALDKDPIEIFALWQKLQNSLAPYRNKPTALDRGLIEAFDRVVEKYPDPQARSEAIEVLGYIAVNLPSVSKLMESRLSNESERKEITDKICKQITDKIHKFNPTGKSLSGSLDNCLYKWVYWRIKDLIDDEDRQEYIELDRSIGDGNTTIGDITSLTVGRDGMDEFIDRLQTEERERQQVKLAIFQQISIQIAEDTKQIYHGTWEWRFIDLIETDRAETISSIYYKIPACNHQYLLRSLIIPRIDGSKPKEVREIIAELKSIEYHALYRYLNDIFYPWLDGLYLEILDDEEWQILKDSIDMQSQKLSEIYRKGAPDCNVYFLAQQLLPCYQKPPITWDELAQKFRAENWQRATPEYIEKFWNNESRPILGKIARQIVEYQ